MTQLSFHLKTKNILTGDIVYKSPQPWSQMDTGY